MKRSILALATIGCLVLCGGADEEAAGHRHQRSRPALPTSGALDVGSSSAEQQPHARPKRTLLLKKKLLGAGLLGFGLGVAKGYKFGYHSIPEVHHVYLAPPSTKYVEYVEKPVYVSRIVEKPVLKPAPHDYEPAPWSQPDPSPAYGPW